MKKLLREDKFDSVVRSLVKDIILLIKLDKVGEFGLPEDLYPEEFTYEFPQLETNFQIFVKISESNQVEGFDVDAEFYPEEELIDMNITVNPSFGNDIIQPLIGELNEVLRHELEHIKQYESGFEFPEEPKEPFKYYSQKHEIEAQHKGFKRRSKKENLRFEDLVRDWFDKNTHKHKMNPKQSEKIIQRILSQK